MGTVFVFGCPGSGKTTVWNCMKAKADQENVAIARIADYAILNAWSQHPTRAEAFRPTHRPGIDILKPEIYDEVIQEVKKRAFEIRMREQDRLLVIDFARWDYSSALSILGTELLREAYVLFMLSEVDTCFQRIEDRSKHPRTIDDHFTPEYVLDFYNQRSIYQYFSSTAHLLKEEYGVSAHRIKNIDNPSGFPLSNLSKEVESLFDRIIRGEDFYSNPSVEVRSVLDSTNAIGSDQNLLAAIG
jgi:adenylate kinase family enzyme